LQSWFEYSNDSSHEPGLVGMTLGALWQ